MKTRWWIACLLLGLAAAQAGEAVYADNVVIVLDCSGSMQKAMRGTRVQKLDAAKVALKEVMATLPMSTQVGLLVFSGGTPGWVMPLGPRQDAAFARAVEALTAGGGTPLGANLKIGADRLLEARQAQYGYGSYRLLVVTDGQATDGNLTEKYAPLILARGIAMDVIGVDMDEDHLLARKANSYRRANDPQALRQAIRDVFAEVGRADGGGTEDEAFAELAGFPAEAAVAVVAALAAPGNEPIGSPPAPSAVASGTAAAPAPQPGPGAPPGAPPPPAPRPPWVLFAVLGFVLVVFLKAVRARATTHRRSAPRRR
jgi:uncharacterized protein YegL